MGRVSMRLQNARKALSTFEEVANLPSPSDVERDAAIKRFEYTFEMVWKTAQAYLFEREFIEVGSPRKAIRASVQVGLFDERTAEKCMQMAKDRNLTVHTYNEEFALRIYQRFAEYASLFRLWLDEIERRS